MNFKFLKIVCLLLLLFFIPGLSFVNSNEKKQDPEKEAYKILRQADSFVRKGDFSKALSAYLKASDIYKKALKKEPDNRNFKTNFRYCLGKRGYVQIKEALKLTKKGDFGRAAKYFKGAEEAYEFALKELPGERNFMTNLKYAKYNGSRAVFESLLEKHGKAPYFELEGFTGKKIVSSDMKDTVVLLEFWAGWCSSCKRSMPKLQNLHKKYFLKGLTIMAVAMDKVKSWRKYGSEKKALKTAKNYNFGFAWGTEKTASDYGNFNSIPTVILIDKRGNLFKKIDYKEQDEKTLSNYIEGLLKQ